VQTSIDKTCPAGESARPAAVTDRSRIRSATASRRQVAALLTRHASPSPRLRKRSAGLCRPQAASPSATAAKASEPFQEPTPANSQPRLPRPNHRLSSSSTRPACLNDIQRHQLRDRVKARSRTLAGLALIAIRTVSPTRSEFVPLHHIRRDAPAGADRGPRSGMPTSRSPKAAHTLARTAGQTLSRGSAPAAVI
jgi:hypothetical protein